MYKRGEGREYEDCLNIYDVDERSVEVVIGHVRLGLRKDMTECLSYGEHVCDCFYFSCRGVGWSSVGGVVIVGVLFLAMILR